MSALCQNSLNKNIVATIYINRCFQLINEHVTLGPSIKLVYSILQNPSIRSTIKLLNNEIIKSSNSTL